LRRYKNYIFFFRKMIGTKQTWSILVSTFLINCFISLSMGQGESSEIFLQLFLAKRMEQLQAVKNILMLDMDKQKSFLDQVTAKMQEVMSRHRSHIQTAGFIPTDGFPEQEELRDSLALVLENSCLFCDIALRIPDEIHRRLKATREFELTVRWSIGFVKDMDFLDESTNKLLNLCAQEINLIDKTPEYHNPYRIKTKPQKRFEAPPPPQKKEKKKLKRGPKMSKTEL